MIDPTILEDAIKTKEEYLALEDELYAKLDTLNCMISLSEADMRITFHVGSPSYDYGYIDCNEYEDDVQAGTIFYKVNFYKKGSKYDKVFLSVEMLTAEDMQIYIQIREDLKALEKLFPGKLMELKSTKNQ